MASGTGNSFLKEEDFTINHFFFFNMKQSYKCKTRSANHEMIINNKRNNCERSDVEQEVKLKLVLGDSY